MIRLDLDRAPRRLDLGRGVTVTVLPLVAGLMAAARADVAARARETGAPIGAIDLVQALGRLAIIAWEGVADAAGDPAQVSRETVDALLDLWPMADAFQAQYVVPALLLEDEKNASAPSPNGTMAGASAIAPDATSPVPNAPMS